MEKTDFDLVSEFLRTDEAGAFEALVDRHARLVHHLAYRITGSFHEAEDVTQEAFLRMLKNLGKYGSDRSFRAWAASIATHVALNAVRSRQRREKRERRKEAVSERHGAPANEPLSEAERKELASQMEERLGELPQENRIPIVLHYMEGLSYAEISEAMGIPEGTAKSRASRGLDRMRESVCTSERRYALPVLIPLLEGIPVPPIPEALLASLKALPLKAALVAGAAAKGTSMLNLAMGIVLVSITVAGGVLLMLGSVGFFITAEDEVDTEPVLTIEDAGLPSLPSEKGPLVEEDDEPAEKPGPPVEAVSPPPQPPPAEIDVPAALPAPPDPEEEKPRIRRVDLDGKRIEELFASGVPVRLGVGGGGGPGLSIVPGKHSMKGAAVYRMKKGEEPEGPAVSFGKLVKVAESEAAGSFKAVELPTGTYFFIANVHNVLNTRRGIDFREARTFTLSYGQTTSGVELRIPVTLAEYGGLEGRVLDENLKPLKRAEVIAGFYRAYTEEDGSFRMPALPAGDIRVSVRYTGYKPWVKTVRINGGSTFRGLEIRLDLFKPGVFTLSGSVADGGGHQLEGVTIYVMAGRGTLRRVKTDASGAFLVERLGPETVKVMASKRGYQSGQRELTLSASEVNFVLEKHVSIRGQVLSDATGEPLQQYNIQVYKRNDLDESVRVGGRAWYSEDGSFEIKCRYGSLIFVVEAPGHGPDIFEINMPVEGEVLEGQELRLTKSEGD
jgi:RNA polymerase sigma factor (sigma-70 family)